MLHKLKTANRQIDVVTLYKIAANSIPDLDLRVKMLSQIKLNSNNPSKIAWKCVIQPTIVLATYYGLLRHGITLSSFTNYLVSAMNSLKTTHLFVNIYDAPKRGLVTFRFISAIIQGKLPNEAANIALKGFDRLELFKFKNTFKQFFTKKSRSIPLRVTDSGYNNNTQNTNNPNSRSNSSYNTTQNKGYNYQYYNNKNTNKKKNPGVICRKCKKFVHYDDLRAHNRSYCKGLV